MLHSLKTEMEPCGYNNVIITGICQDVTAERASPLTVRRSVCCRALGVSNSCLQQRGVIHGHMAPSFSKHVASRSYLKISCSVFGNRWSDMIIEISFITDICH